MARAQDDSTSAVHELPDGPPDAVGLTPRQRRVLAYIGDSVESRVAAGPGGMIGVPTPVELPARR